MNMYAYPNEFEQLVKTFIEAFGSNLVSIVTDLPVDWVDTTVWNNMDIHMKQLNIYTFKADRKIVHKYYNDNKQKWL